ncbi:MAG: hypothetical protein KDC71_24270, partial [Acidobacteria bacterium]|nr:hypothetical protein [Acidobacteriota bacterium]
LEGQSCSSADWAHPSADEFHLGATVHDRVGNLKTLEVGPVFRDAEGPLIEWHFLQPDYQDPKGRAWFRKSGAELQIAVKDGLSGVNRLEWRVEGQTWQVLDQRQIRVTTPISLRAWDRVDNQTTMSVALLIDADAPEIAVSENGQPLKVDWLNPVPAAARVSLAFSDAGCGVAERILRVYPANRSPDGAPSLTFPAGEARILVITGKGPRYQLHSQPSEDRDWIYFERAGVYWIEITAVDYLGNRKKSDFGFWVGDYGMVAP